MRYDKEKCVNVFKTYIEQKRHKNGVFVMSEDEFKKLSIYCKNTTYTALSRVMIYLGYTNIYVKEVEYTGYLWKKNKR